MRGLSKVLMMSVLLMVSASALSASDLSVAPYQAGGWQIQLDGNMLSMGAGSDLIGSVSSSTACDQLSVDTDAQDDSWSIVVFLQRDPSPFTVEILVTDEGTGDDAVTYSDDFETVTTESMSLISGTGDRDGIEVQYRLSGISIETITSTQYSMDLLYVLNL